MEYARIRQLREGLGETQAQFAARFSVSQIAVAHWESGRSKPNALRLKALDDLNKIQSLACTRAPTALFRPIQYLGSKLRLAESIGQVVDEFSAPGARAADLFAGSGVVSHTLARSRPVTAVDIQAYSTFLCKALLEVQPEAFEHLLTDEFSARVKEFYGELIAAFGPLIEVEQAAHRLARDGSTESLAAIVEYGSLAGFAQRPPAECPKQLRAAIKSVLANVERASLQEKAVASFYYGGAYFSYAQALILDAIYLAGAQLGADTRVAALATLLSTASEVVNTVGKQFAQPIKLLKADGTTPKILLSRTLRDRSIEPLPMFMAWVEKWRQAVSSRLPVSHGTRCGDVAEFVETDQACGIYYADPPYTIDHYSRFYHVLETLVLRDEPTLDEMQKKGRSAVMRGIYRSGRYQSPFSIPSSVSSAFERLFYAVASRRAPLILSYSPFDVSEGHRPRLLSLEQLTLLARRYFSSVEVLEVNEHSHRKLNAKALNVPIKSDGERLIVCR